MSEFAPICIYLVISPLVSLIPLGVVRPIQKNCRPTNVVPIPPVMPEVVSIYDFIRFLFYLLSLIWKSPFLFLGQYLLTRLICLDSITFSFPWAVPPNQINLFLGQYLLTRFEESRICWEFRIVEREDLNMVKKDLNRNEWKMPLELFGFFGFRMNRKLLHFVGRTHANSFF